ncbi:hypothetical protein [Nocardioides hwasunensis]|uniref:DUF732 domain-containing protein n=1 Tax=Nocardioides hwasunensis TaxID=397258 RepID=A0ABR8MJW8_9ACTN|nr:hypothetical protein [Nocardioides hwasunensis]MBD3916333.1 hypothetical protein [Nocardioides hwasunensis]
MKTTTSLKMIAAGLMALTLLTGCGGSSGGRPSVDEISTSLQNADNPLGLTLEEKQADCIAEAFHESDISDDTLQAIVDQDKDYEPSDDDEQAVKDMSTEGMAECMAG